VRCHIHQKENIITPAPPQQPNHMTINMNRTKQIWSNRLGIKYQKNINQYKDSPYLSDKCFTLYQRKDTQLTKAQTKRLERYLKSPKNSRIRPLIAKNLLQHSAYYVLISHCKKQVRKLQDQERLVRSSRDHRNMETTHTQVTPTPTRQDVQNILPSLPTQDLTSYPPFKHNDPKNNMRSLLAFLFNPDDHRIIESFCHSYKGKIGKILRNWTKMPPDNLRTHLQPKWDKHKRNIEKLE